jgi:hypothetical protein
LKFVEIGFLMVTGARLLHAFDDPFRPSRPCSTTTLDPEVYPVIVMGSFLGVFDLSTFLPNVYYELTQHIEHKVSSLVVQTTSTPNRSHINQAIDSIVRPAMFIAAST